MREPGAARQRHSRWGAQACRSDSVGQGLLKRREQLCTRTFCGRHEPCRVKMKSVNTRRRQKRACAPAPASTNGLTTSHVISTCIDASGKQPIAKGSGSWTRRVQAHRRSRLAASPADCRHASITADELIHRQCRPVGPPLHPNAAVKPSRSPCDSSLQCSLEFGVDAPR